MVAWTHAITHSTALIWAKKLTHESKIKVVVVGVVQQQLQSLGRFPQLKVDLQILQR